MASVVVSAGVSIAIGGRSRSLPTEPLGGNDEDHDEAVERKYQRRRHLNGALQSVAPDQQAAKQECGRDGPHGMEAAEQRGHDAVEARTSGESCGRAIGDHAMTLAPEDEDCTGETGHCTAQSQRKHDGSLHVNACVASSIGVCTDRTQPVSERRAPQQDVGANRSKHCENRPDVETP